MSHDMTDFPDVVNLADIPHIERTAADIFADQISDGFSTDTAFIITARVIGAFPYKTGELAELVRVYDAMKMKEIASLRRP